MVLVFDGIIQKAPPRNLGEFLQANPRIRRQSEMFLEIPTKTVGPHRLLYVDQKELAITKRNDPNVEILGSGDATTCVIAVLRHSICGAIALSHMDGGQTEDCVARMVDGVTEIAGGSGSLELQLFGACGGLIHSENTFFSVMQHFHLRPEKVHVVRACVGELNTTVKNGVCFPALYGVVVLMRSGEVFPAVFTDTGPDISLRHARLLHGDQSQIMEIYNSETGMLKISPFKYSRLQDAELLLHLPDETLLRFVSTSPEVEPPHFLAQIREALKCIVDDPFPMDTIFKFNKPRCYVRDDSGSGWRLVEE